MSTFGGPGGRQIIAKPIPPERGSFPLDHDAECQPIMKQYLRCLRAYRGVNDDECRQLSKGYLQCRMERFVGSKIFLAYIRKEWQLIALMPAGT